MGYNIRGGYLWKKSKHADNLEIEHGSLGWLWWLLGAKLFLVGVAFLISQCDEGKAPRQDDSDFSEIVVIDGQDYVRSD